MIAKTHDPKSINARSSTARVAPSSPPILLREDVGGIAILTLNRPEARNSLSEALLAALANAFTEIAHEQSVRAVVLAANGPAFSAGHDLKELKRHRSDSDRGRAYFKYIILLLLCVRFNSTSNPIIIFQLNLNSRYEENNYTTNCVVIIF